MSMSLELIKKFKLDNYLSFFLTKNKAIDAPYHNLYHTFCVIENCFKISKDENLSEPEIRILVLAALFHDFGHSHGKETDDKNVKLAQEKFLEASQESDEDNNKIIELILATQYPYVISDEKLSLSQKILRDADMMQMFEKNFLQQIWVGLLQQELKKSPKEAVELQLKFMQSAKFYTNYAKKVNKELLPIRIKAFEYIKSKL